jgi:hypothetical protein
MVGTTKRCIKKVLGKRQVDDEKMNTILASIEAAINSRPLTQDDGLQTSTPARHYPDWSGAHLDQKSDKGIPNPTTGRRGHLEEMEQ